MNLGELHMGYQINKRVKKDGTAYWRVILRDFKHGIPKDRHVPATQYLNHGFRSDMTVEQAKERASQLNAKLTKEKRIDRRKMVMTHKRIADQKLNEKANFPLSVLEEFETVYLRKRMCIGASGEQKLKKAMSHWAYVKRMIVELSIDPQDWADESRQFFNYFQKRECKKFCVTGDYYDRASSGMRSPNTILS